MLIAVPRETLAGERRVALVPAAVTKLVKLGMEVAIEPGAGASAGFLDAEYEAAGAGVRSRDALLGAADVVLRVRKPEPESIALLKQGAIHVSFLDPFNERGLIEQLAAAKITALSVEMIPRSTYAQKMDALSSQANLAGYVSVVLAARHMQKILPMMMTPSGTISPAKVFIIGAGVAGLQAIATAKRMGARVEAFDTRPVVAEQVQSLGAKFVQIDLGETGQTAQGYARELTPEQIAKQQAGMAAVIAGSDMVITTAQVFGRPAPRIVTRAMVEAMKPGSVVLDMAVETGGNVEGSRLEEIADLNGVQVLGFGNLPSYVPRNASEMYAANLVNLVSEFWNREAGALQFGGERADIGTACIITNDGAVVNEQILARYNG